ncbi:DM13 domain-containing protein [Nocardioides caeni]|uniref:DM13 domain-containing protein n=1 Tax=Nocardioides caeni TaxID=574700 RepID=A0A4S8NGA3_9ACTN|nr:DM13 domain-containing protein [Nocardioides caeni]THV15883.1 hypothetical protein E9934_05980 [Nocardioides caeni]
MSRKRAIWLSIGGVLLVVLVVAMLVFQPWLLFVDDEVDEADDDSRVVGTASAGLTQTEAPSADGSQATRVELASAEFIDAEHGTTGTATIYLRSDGSRFLRLTDFETSNGPDLHVWITDRRSGGDCEGCFDSWGIYDDGEHVGLGELKGNVGAQSYEIPEDADLADMRSVVVWCDRFNVAFGTADIT